MAILFNKSARNQLALASIITVLSVVLPSTPADADKNPGGQFFRKGGLYGPTGIPTPTGGNAAPSWLNKLVPANSAPPVDPVYGHTFDPVPSATPAIVVPIWNAYTHPVPLNPSAPKNLSFPTWTITEKKTNQICGTWTWNQSTQNFTANYNGGFSDCLRVDQFTDTNVSFSGYNNLNLPLRYVGTRSGNTAKGTATCDTPTGPFIWGWSATW